MRLRRETGDWTIKVKVDPEAVSGGTLITTQLPKGLSAEDFIGAVVDSGESYQVITAAYIVANAPYSVRVVLGMREIYYDRRSGHLSFDPEDFDPVEPDEGREDVTGFVVTQEGSGLDGEYTVTPSTVTFTEDDSKNYTSPWHKFIGKTVTDADGETYTITEEMIGPAVGSGVPLYFVNPTEKSGKRLLLTSSGSGSTFPMVMTVTYSNFT